ncbi:MAG: hypothetical protein H0V81_13205 [Solirubrobacterales bacterium]|nr:hypothetical protein [Solirubrobacterales bacterium]
MSLLLLFFAALTAFILFLVLAAKVYPRFQHQPPAKSEQELTGIGPESTQGELDDNLMG